MDTEACTANMMGTKLEVKMKKGETGSWAKLDIPRPVAEREVKLEEEAPKEEPLVDALELDDLDLQPTKLVLSKEAQMRVN